MNLCATFFATLSASFSRRSSRESSRENSRESSSKISAKARPMAEKLRLWPACLLLALIAGLPGTLSAMPTEPGLPVKKIPFASEIDAWQALDKRRLIVSTSPSKNYLVTLRQECHALRFSSRLGISSSNNTVYAGFDYITADGERCAIQRINRISSAEKRALSEV